MVMFCESGSEPSGSLKAGSFYIFFKHTLLAPFSLSLLFFHDLKSVVLYYKGKKVSP
jgi:hypothetical protein